MKEPIALSGSRVAILLPCLNEEITLRKVIRDFRNTLPSADIYVFDNNSTDRSPEIAREEGVHLITVKRPGKGNVVQRMFEAVEADVYVMVDSDDTYEPEAIHELIRPVLEGEADMVVASRLGQHTKQAFRKFHRFGNKLIMQLINTIFDSQLIDICSGYRAMSRKLVKGVPVMRHGFEVETELTVYSLIYGYTILEKPFHYRQRPEKSFSKLRTFHDGYRVLLAILWLARDLRPLLFFSVCATALFLGVTVPLRLFVPQAEFWQLGSLMASLLLGTTGLVLQAIHIRLKEMWVLNQRSQAAPVASTVLTPRRRPAAVSELSQ